MEILIGLFEEKHISFPKVPVSKAEVFAWNIMIIFMHFVMHCKDLYLTPVAVNRVVGPHV